MRLNIPYSKLPTKHTFMHLSYPLILYLYMYVYIYIYIESKIHVRYWQLALSVWRVYKYTILNITVRILAFEVVGSEESGRLLLLLCPAKTRNIIHIINAKSSSVLTHIVYIMNQNTVWLWYTHACMHVHIHVYMFLIISQCLLWVNVHQQSQYILVIFSKVQPWRNEGRWWLRCSYRWLKQGIPIFSKHLSLAC